MKAIARSLTSGDHHLGSIADEPSADEPSADESSADGTLRERFRTVGEVFKWIRVR